LLVLGLEEVRSNLLAYLFQLFGRESGMPERLPVLVQSGDFNHLPVFEPEDFPDEVVFAPSLHYEANARFVVVPAGIKRGIVPIVDFLSYRVGFGVFAGSVRIVDN